MLGDMVRSIRSFLFLPLSLKSLILNSFLVAFGSYMVTPFLAVYLKQGIGLDLSTVGILVASSTFIQFSGGVAGGVIAEKFGFKRTMVLALILRTLGFVLLAIAKDHAVCVIPAVVLVAIGPALYLPANRAYIVCSVPNHLRPLFLSISNAALNAGMAVGPLLAALWIEKNPDVLFLAVAALFAILAFLHQIQIHPDKRGSSSLHNNILLRLPEAFVRVYRPAVFNTIAFYVYFFFQNFMGLYVSVVLDLQAFSWIMLLNFSLMFLLQPLLARRIANANYRALLAFAFTVMALGMLILSQERLAFLLLGTVLMTLGEAILFLRGDLEVISRLPDMPAIAFGIQRLGMGIGGFFSGLVGGVLFAHYKSVEALELFWVAVAAQCVVAVGLTFFLADNPRSRLVATQAS